MRAWRIVSMMIAIVAVGIHGCDGGAGSRSDAAVGGDAGIGGVGGVGGDAGIGGVGGSGGSGGGANVVAGVISSCTSEPRADSQYCVDIRGAVSTCPADKRVAVRSARGSCGLRTNGTIACWASIDFAGNADDPSPVPVEVPDIDDASILSVDAWHACAVRADRSVWCWGSEEYGRLGNPTPPALGHPTVVMGLDDVIALNTHHGGMCAVRGDGTLWCWGQNARWDATSQTFVHSVSPVQVEGIDDAVGVEGNSILLASGEVAIRLNDRTVRTVPDLHDAVSVTTDGCALRRNGDVVCWLTPWTQSDPWPGPYDVVRGHPAFDLPPFVALSAGGDFKCGLTRCGQVVCWGRNHAGQVGSEVRADDAPPTLVAGIDDAIAIEAGGAHVCAMRATGALACWGAGSAAELGAGPAAGVASRVQLTPQVASIDISGDPWCTIALDGSVMCSGRLPGPSLGGSYYPYGTSEGLPGVVDAINVSGGTNHACATRRGGTIACWGTNSDGQVGGPNAGRTKIAVDVAGIDDATSVGSGLAFSCALRSSGRVSCWGDNDHGELGNGTNQGSLVPIDVVGISDATQLSVGHNHACAIVGGGQVACWGETSFGKLGQDLPDGTLAPVIVADIDDASAIGAGTTHTCVLRSNAVVTCWGWDGASPQRPLMTPGAYHVLRDVSGLNQVTTISVGEQHACALQAGGHIKCWGSNAFGELGDHTLGPRYEAVEVIDVVGATSISAGSFQTCAVLGDDSVWCWGAAGTFNGRPYTPLPIEAMWHAE